MKPSNIYSHKGKFFHILDKTELSQTAVMTLGVGEDSGQGDMHPGDQVVYVIEGSPTVKVENEEHELTAGATLIIPKGKEHRIYNRSEDTVFLLNVYAPPSY